jgi:hypothetical protein
MAAPDEAGAPASASVVDVVVVDDEVSVPPDEVPDDDEVPVDEVSAEPPPQAMAIAPTRAVTESRTRTRFIVSSSSVGATACHSETRAKRRTGEVGTLAAARLSSFEIHNQSALFPALLQSTSV